MLTLVIGVGNGGIKILKTLNQMVEATNEISQYRFIAIDSNGEDINKHVGFLKNTTNIVISDAHYQVQDLLTKCPYLYSGVQVQQGGALRERGYGRFLYDLNRSRVEQVFSKNLKAMREELTHAGIDGQGHLLIWIVHTLGGGTGSGTFPSLVQHISKLATDTLEGAMPSLIPHVFCVGILPSGSNIADITNVQFNPKYLANSLGALEEIKILANASPNNPVSITTLPQGKMVVSTKPPFNRYFLFGIKEDMVTNIDEEKVQEFQDYLSDSNKVIATMMYSIPLHNNGASFENLWQQYPRPFIIFGESELIVPLNDIKKVAEENDILGKPIEENQDLKEKIRKEVASTAETSESDITEILLETRANDVFNTYRLIGLCYYLGKIQWKYLNKVSNAQNDLEITLNGYLEKLGKNEILMQWYQDTLKDMDASTVTLVDKARALIDALRKRKEDYQKLLTGFFMPIRFKKQEAIEGIIKTINIIISTINKKIDTYQKYQKMKKYIDNEIGKKLPISAVGQDPGVAKIVAYIKKRALELDNLKNKLTNGGRGRVTSVPLARTKLDLLSLNDKESHIDVMNSIPTFISSLGIESNEIQKIFKNRINQTKSLDLGIAHDMSVPDRGIPTPKMAILYNQINDQILSGDTASQLSDVALELMKSNSFSSERLSFVHFILNIEIEDILEYRHRKLEYEDGRLKEEARMTEPVATIFAHPEWFKEDPLVKKAFPNLK
jgi:hypothetical protein